MEEKEEVLFSSGLLCGLGDGLGGVAECAAKLSGVTMLDSTVVSEAREGSSTAQTNNVPLLHARCAACLLGHFLGGKLPSLGALLTQLGEGSNDDLASGAARLLSCRNTECAAKLSCVARFDDASVTGAREGSTTAQSNNVPLLHTRGVAGILGLFGGRMTVALGALLTKLCKGLNGSFCVVGGESKGHRKQNRCEK